MVNSAAFSADGAVVMASNDKTVRAWEAATGKEIARFEGHVDTIWRTAADWGPAGVRIPNTRDAGLVHGRPAPE
jgi:hypothetical protein